MIPRLFMMVVFGMMLVHGHHPAQAAEDIQHIVVFAKNGAGCADGAVNFFFSYIPNSDDAQRDWVDVGLYDAEGVMLAFGSYSAEAEQLGESLVQIGAYDLSFNALGNAPAARPFFLSFRDGTATSTQATFEDAQELARYPFDPVAVGATRCDVLPYLPPDEGFADGRINWRDNQQTVAVYCERDGSVTLLAINQETGRALYAVRASLRDIARVGIPQQDPALIRQDTRNAVRLYRLNTGEFQAVAPYTDAVQGLLPNGYLFIWDGCATPNRGIRR